MLFDLKVISSVLEELQEKKGISKEEVIQAIESSIASAYKKEYCERGQNIQAKINLETGNVNFFRVKEVVLKEKIISEEDYQKLNKEEYLELKEKGYIRFNEQRHILIDNAKFIKKDAETGEELLFELENKTDFSRVAAQSAKQTIFQKIKEAEKKYIKKEFGDKEGNIVSGQVIRSESGVIFVDLGKAEGILLPSEQIKSERYKTGDKIRAYLVKTNEKKFGGVELLLSRTHPEFLRKLFEEEVPEIKEGFVEIKKIVREPGVRSKIAVIGQSGSRVNVVSSELSGEKIDIIEWLEEIENFIVQSLSPAEILEVKIIKNEDEKKAIVFVSEDQYSLAIGRRGQNSRLASKITDIKIDIRKMGADGEEIISEKKDN